MMFEFGMSKDGKVLSCYRVEVGYAPSKKDKVKIFIIEPIFQACKKYAASQDDYKTFFWTDNATFAFTRVFCDMYEQCGENVRKVANGFLVPVYGKLPSTFQHTIDFASCGAIPTKFLPSKRGFFTYDEALKQVEKYVENDKPYQITIRYGSDIYGQSFDCDAVYIIGYGQRFKELAMKIESAPVDLSADIIRINTRATTVHPMERLAAECLIREQPATRDLLAGWLDKMSLEEALQKNTEYRVNLARFFPCDFTLRKAVFAQAQYQAYQQDGVFVDNKETALAYCQNQEVVRRLFFHEASPGDVEYLYYATFHQALPDDVRVIKSERNLYILHKGHIYISRYYSNYGYDEHLELTSDSLVGIKKLSPVARIAEYDDDVLYIISQLAAGEVSAGT